MRYWHSDILQVMKKLTRHTMLSSMLPRPHLGRLRPEKRQGLTGYEKSTVVLSQLTDIFPQSRLYLLIFLLQQLAYYRKVEASGIQARSTTIIYHLLISGKGSSRQELQCCSLQQVSQCKKTQRCIVREQGFSLILELRCSSLFREKLPGMARSWLT